MPLGTLYRQYIRDTKGRKDRKRLVMVGSNEGMVHAFDAQTGAERFAYVPMRWQRKWPVWPTGTFLTSGC